jgi:hypothetical protein
VLVVPVWRRPGHNNEPIRSGPAPIGTRTMQRCLAALAAATCLASCAGPVVKPALAPAAEHRDAVLILPGFGYGRGEGKVFAEFAASASRDGVDVYVAPFLTRSGLDDGRARLERFIRDERLDRYTRLHVFAFIAGAWTLNPLLDRLPLSNLATVVYDRSPYQERAPKIAVTKLRRRAWLRYGRTIFDVARLPYPPNQRPRVRVALLVESAPTPFMTSHAKDAAAYGPFEFRCDSLGQRYDDCAYVAMNHADMYARFADLWPDVYAFVQTGRFTVSADRTPPVNVSLDQVRR